MDQTLAFLTILGMAAVTYLPRAVPLLWLSSRPLPSAVTSWLRHVPVAVLSAMLFPALMSPEAANDHSRVFLLAALPTAIVAWRTRSLAGAVLAGIGAVLVGRHLLGL